MNAVNVQVFVPLADNAGAARPEVVVEVAAYLSEVAGGATIHAPSEGFWADPRTGKVVRESVQIVEAHTSTERGALKVAAREAAAYVKRELSQQSVLIRCFELETESI